MKKPQKKYRILTLMKGLSMNDYTLAKEWLPEQLGISPRTFNDWCYIPENSEREIPVEKAYMICSFFNIPIEDFFTQAPKNLNVQWMDRDAANKQLSNILKS